MYEELADFCERNKVLLVAVTKTKSQAVILDLYEKGQRHFGENRVSELAEKQEALPKDIQWHMIGHLQSNKVKYISSFVSMIHSGGSLSLMKEINKRAAQQDRIIDVLLQIKIGQEEAKSGWDIDELISNLSNNKIQQYPNICVRGVMGMATYTSDKSIIRKEFNNLRSYFQQIKDQFYSDEESFDTISMGMSGDYKIAVEEGSTMVRIGSLLYQ